MRVALALPAEAAQELVGSAEYHGHQVVARCTAGDELALRLAELPVECAIVLAQEEHLTRRLVQAADLLGIRLVVVASDAEQERHAVRLGIIDAVPGPPGWALLDPDGSAPVASPPAGRSPQEVLAGAPLLRASGPAMTLAVWGPHGAPGRTSLAIALAAESATIGHGTVLVDADTHAASVAPALGLLDEAPGFAAACRLAGLGALDRTQLERLAVVPAAARHPFRVLTGIARASRWPELGGERVAGVLSALRGFCEVVVVDVAASLERDDELASDLAAPRRNAAALEALRVADRVVAVAAADPVGVPRFLRAHAELLELVDPARVTVVVNKVRAGAIGVGAGTQLRQTLARFGGIDDPVLVPWDPGAFDAAVLSGRPLADAAPRSAARVAVRGLAAALLPAGETRRARRRPGRRLA